MENQTKLFFNINTFSCKETEFSFTNKKHVYREKKLILTCIKHALT